MRLHHWTHPKKEIEFDVSDGEGKVVKLENARNEKSECPGYAASERRIFGLKEHFAIFKNGKGIVFYAGKMSWQLGGAEIKIVHKRPYPFVSRFLVIVSGKKVYSITYTHIMRLLHSFIDPTYDKIEQDSDFFLEFIAEKGNSPEWLHHIERIWCQAKNT